MKVKLEFEIHDPHQFGTMEHKNLSVKIKTYD